MQKWRPKRTQKMSKVFIHDGLVNCIVLMREAMPIPLKPYIESVTALSDNGAGDPNTMINSGETLRLAQISKL